jgi:hypothetical protein
LPARSPMAPHVLRVVVIAAPASLLVELLLL